MKRICISLAIIGALALAAVGHVRCLNELTEELCGLLVQAEGQVAEKNWAGAESLTRQALEDWEAHGFYLHTVLRHEETDGVLTAFHEVLAYLEGGEQQPAEYAAANARLLTAIRLLAEEEAPSLRNIL